MRLLNLLSGKDSVAIPRREAGHEEISADIDPRYSPEICKDILQLSYCKLSTPYGPRHHATNMPDAGPRPKRVETQH